MDKGLCGKGYIRCGEGFFVASTGERYEYHDGELTRTSAAGPAWRKVYVSMNCDATRRH